MVGVATCNTKVDAPAGGIDGCAAWTVPVLLFPMGPKVLL